MIWFTSWWAIAWSLLMVVAIVIGIRMVRRGAIFTGTVQLVLCSTSLLLHVALLATNASAGCYPWSPATVPYHEGMTLCPGQSAVGGFRLEEPEPPPSASTRV